MKLRKWLCAVDSQYNVVLTNVDIPLFDIFFNLDLIIHQHRILEYERAASGKHLQVFEPDHEFMLNTQLYKMLIWNITMVLEFYFQPTLSDCTLALHLCDALELGRIKSPWLMFGQTITYKNTRSGTFTQCFD